MTAINVCIGHNDDATIAQPFYIKVIANSGAQSRDERAHFVVTQDFVKTGPLGIEDLTVQRQDRLEVAVASLLGGAACRVTLHDVELGLRRVAFGAIRQFARQCQRLERRLADDKVACLFRCVTRTSGGETLGDNRLCCLRIFLQECAKRLTHHLRDVGLRLRVHQLDLGLRFKLWVWVFDRNDRGQPFTCIIA